MGSVEGLVVGGSRSYIVGTGHVPSGLRLT